MKIKKIDHNMCISASHVYTHNIHILASIVLLKTATIKSSTTDGSDNSTIWSDREEGNF